MGAVHHAVHMQYTCSTLCSSTLPGRPGFPHSRSVQGRNSAQATECMAIGGSCERAMRWSGTKRGGGVGHALGCTKWALEGGSFRVPGICGSEGPPLPGDPTPGCPPPPPPPPLPLPRPPWGCPGGGGGLGSCLDFSQGTALHRGQCASSGRGGPATAPTSSSFSTLHPAHPPRPETHPGTARLCVSSTAAGQQDGSTCRRVRL